MYNGSTKSLGSVIWKIMKYPFMEDLTYEIAAEYALEYIKLMGAPVIYLDTITEPIKLTDYKARLPNDILWVKGVKYMQDKCDVNTPNGEVAMQSATDIYHAGSVPHNVNSADIPNNQGFNYIIEKGIIKTSMSEGYVVVSYKAVATDENGFPLIPDKTEFMLGLEFYTMERYLYPLWMMGKITDKVFNDITQKSNFYYGSAHTGLRMPDTDKMESIMNGINRLITNTTAHRDFFRNYGEKEYIRTYH